MNNLEAMSDACSLECIVEPQELLFSGAMAPLSFKQDSVSSNELCSASLLNYASGILKEHGIFSSSIKPESVDSGVFDLSCEAAKVWSGAPSPGITPKTADYASKSWDKIVDELNLNAPSHTLQPLNKSDFSHDWSSQNNVLSGFNSPSSSFGISGKKEEIYTTPDFKMPEIPEFKAEMPKLPEFKTPDMPKFEPCIPHQLPTFELPLSKFEPDFQIDPYRKNMQLEGGITLKGSRNTAIFKEPLGEGFFNIYSHHEKGYGRAELDLKPFRGKGIKIFDYPYEK